MSAIKELMEPKSAIKELIDAVQGTPIIRFDRLAQAATVEHAALEADSKRLEFWEKINKLPYDSERPIIQYGNGRWDYGIHIRSSTCFNVISSHDTFREAIDAAMSRDADEPGAVTDE